MQFSFTKILYVVNVLLLVLALLFTGLFLAVKFVPEKVDGVGLQRTLKYSKSGRVAAQEAIEAAEAGNEAPAVKLLTDWSHIQKRDRYDIHKREVFVGLAKLWISQNRYEETVELAVPFRSDDRDITVFTLWADSAARVDRFHEEAVLAITEMRNKFPKSRDIAKLYVDHVLDKNDAAARNAVIVDLKVGEFSPPSEGWVMYWRNKGSYAGKLKRANLVERDGKWVFSTRLPREVKQIRIDPPRGSLFKLSNMNLTFGNAGENIPIKRTLNRSEVQIEGGKLLVLGELDPFFAINVAALAKKSTLKPVNGHVPVALSFEMEPYDPPWLTDLLEVN